MPTSTWSDDLIAELGALRVELGQVREEVTLLRRSIEDLQEFQQAQAEQAEERGAA